MVKQYSSSSGDSWLQVRKQRWHLHMLNPGINLKAIGMGPPPTPGSGVMHTEAHYAAATEAAEGVVKLIEDETDSIHQQQWEL